jgi:hypothetical protein
VGVVAANIGSLFLLSYNKEFAVKKKREISAFMLFWIPGIQVAPISDV